MSGRQKILIGYIKDGHAGGVDRFILDVVYTLDCKKYSIDILTNHIDEQLKAELTKRSIGLYEIPTLKHPFRQYEDIKTLMLKKKYDIAYFNISTAVHCIGVLAASKTHIAKRVVHSHSSGLDIENKIVRGIMRCIHSICKPIISNKATDFIACSQKAGEWLYSKSALNGKRYFVVHNSLNLEKFKFDENIRKKIRQENDWDRKTIVIHVGNFNYSKNHFFLIDAFRKVVARNSKYILVLAGKGAREKTVRKKVKEYGLEKNIVFMGMVTNVNELLNAADIFVLPSNFEGYPISALEAQMNRLPCLLSDHITKESKISSKCKFLPLNQNTWAKAILQQCVGGLERTEMDFDAVEAYDTKTMCDTIEKILSRE